MSGEATLFERATSFASLLLATRRAARGKRHRREVQRLLFDLEPTLLRLVDDLSTGAWQPGPYRTFTVYEPKQRLIAAAPIADRIVHHAVCAALEPIFERHSIYHSYACRVGKGTHAAVRRARRLARRHRYFLKADVRKFFDSVDHAVLMDQVRRLVDDQRFVALVGRIVAHQPPGAVAEKGLPIGNLTSQHLANLYLRPVDRALCRELGERCYLRYMDDLLVFTDDKSTAHRARAVAETALSDIALTLKAPATMVAPVTEGIPFLGMRIFRGTVRLQHAARSRLLRDRRRRLRAAADAAHVTDSFIQSETSVFGHLAGASTFAMRRQVLRNERGLGA